MAHRLHRRSFLRGVGGIAIGLPLLEIMLNESGTAYAQGREIPCRYVVSFGGFSLGPDGGLTAQYAPQAVGPAYALTPVLAPLANHGNLQSDVTVVSGLQIPAGQSKTDTSLPPGGRTAEFHFHMAPLLCGQRMVAQDDPNVEGNGSSFLFNSDVTAPSSDQIVAEQIGMDTVFYSLVYRAQASLYPGLGDAYLTRNHGTMSHRREGSQTVRIEPVVSPRLAYDTLFAGFAPQDPAQAAAKARELAKRKSVLDLVDRRMGGKVDQLGATDRIRLERHLDEIRALELQLDAVDPSGTGACELPPDPGDDPPVGGSGSDWGDVNVHYSDENARARTFADILAMALTCDLTRVASFMLTAFQSNLNAHPIIDVPTDLHSANHSTDKATIEAIAAWHIDHFAYLAAKLRDTPEGDGSVLDHSALVFVNEGGHGLDPADAIPSSSHSTDGMVALVVGGAGGLRRGEHIVAPASANHLGNVLISAMSAVDPQLDTLGEVSGVIPELFG